MVLSKKTIIFQDSRWVKHYPRRGYIFFQGPGGEGQLPEGYSELTVPIDAVNSLPLTRFEPMTSTTPLALHQTSTLPSAPLRHPRKRVFK